jgi:hypothetical protein
LRRILAAPDNDDPAEFTFYENWTDRLEWDKHMEMPHLQKFAEAKDKVFELQKLRLMTTTSARSRKGEYGNTGTRRHGPRGFDHARPRSMEVLNANPGVLWSPKDRSA